MTEPVTKRVRRRHVDRPDIRANLLAAADALIREDGYAAATARRIADRVGLKHQVVFYYFGSQDELLIEVHRQAASAHERRLLTALESPNPLSAIWEAIRDPDMVRFTLEFIALGNHNDRIRAEVASTADAIRKLESDGIMRHLRERGIEPRLSPNTISILSNAVARFLSQEASLGIDLGHAEVERLIEDSFRSFEAGGDTTAELQPLVSAMSGKPPIS